jgi:hypothetical protein
LNPGWALVHIANEAFVIVPAALIVYEFPGSYGPLTGSLGLVGSYCQTTVCGLAVATGLPGSGWSISYSVCSSLPCSSTSLSFTVPLGASVNTVFALWMQVQVWQSGSEIEFTSCMLYVFVL